MTRGLSLHVGLNFVDPARYSGWDGELGACEADATGMEELARQLGYQPRVLLTAAATRDAVQGAIRAAAVELRAGDTFLATYAGHGGQVPDANGDEADGSDETWCLHDGQLIDDELFELWKEFAPGVRVVVVSDSCHSGTVIRAAKGQLRTDDVEAELRRRGFEEPRFRYLPPRVARDTYLANRAFYDGLGKAAPREAGEPRATVRLLSGCDDDQVAADGTFHGLFTGTLLGVWDGGRFTGDYPAFHAELVSRMPDFQRPNHLVVGPADPAFDRQRPFSISG